MSTPVRIREDEVEFSAVRAQGAGGQHVNKTSSAVQLRFDVQASRLPESCKQRLLTLADRRIGADGVIVIKAQRFRSQPQNRDDALQRLNDLVAKGFEVPKARKPTQPSRNARRKRVDSKVRRGQLKSLRSPVRDL
ncbi:MAG: alternative ribosome rescue aminoacyl-tRNA hydrolase ArfB [Nevskiales bacterium]|nr:alternative ribosome rescue aminoacyl-tRNA hydrolase ArfB [Nevskiales bacterium]